MHVVHFAHFSQLQGGAGPSEVPPGVHGEAQEMSPQEMFKHFDSDGSGKLSRAEAEDGIIKMFRPHAAAVVSASFDKHAGTDNQVDLAEFIAIAKDGADGPVGPPPVSC
jgi:hypothetical protein